MTNATPDAPGLQLPEPHIDTTAHASASARFLGYTAAQMREMYQRGLAARPLPSDWVAVPRTLLESIRDSSSDLNARGFADGALKAAPSAPAEGGENRPAPQDCSHRFGCDPRVCLRCGWDFRKNGDPPDVETAPEPLAQGEASIAAAVSEAIDKLEDIAHRIAHVSPNVSEELVQLRTILLVGRLASPQPAAEGQCTDCEHAPTFRLLCEKHGHMYAAGCAECEADIAMLSEEPNPPQPSASVGERDEPVSEEWALRAMAKNYGDGPHRWDHLDRGVCERAADEIKALRDALTIAAAGGSNGR